MIQVLCILVVVFLTTETNARKSNYSYKYKPKYVKYSNYNYYKPSTYTYVYYKGYYKSTYYYTYYKAPVVDTTDHYSTYNY